jgi:signal transduction histidine kinase/DNA-binding response OmpR family regulator
MNAQPADRSSLPFLRGGGEMGARMRGMDWSATLGPPEQWPQSLRSTVSMLLPSRAQIVLFWGPAFVVLYNDAYRPVFGAKHPHVLGRPGAEAWREIWDSQLRALLEGVVRTGEAFWAKDLRFEIERHGFPEETYFDVSYDPVRIESGAVGGVFCIVAETTERVVGERRMALLRDLAARNAAARTVREACVLAMEMLAVNPADVSFALAYVDDELQGATPGAAQRLADAKPDEIRRLTIPPAAGGGRPARLIVGINPRRPYDDGYRSFLTLVADQLATAIANARAHEEGRQRAEALAAVDRAKTAFFSNVSHEFRTPLTLMMGPLEDLLARAPAGGSSHDDELLRVIHRNGLRLQKLVNTLLEFSRIEAGRVRARFVPVDLAAVTAELASTFRSAMEQAGLRFTIDGEAIGAPVFVDRDMWEKVVLNLVSNAFKFTLSGGVAVRVRSGGDGAVLEVADTGVGIPPAELANVFERFHRVEASRGRSHEGSGIGLALVSELVKLHGGRIAVDSQVGAGTTFTVSIPFGSAHLPPDQVAADGTQARSERGAYVEEALGWLRQPAGERADAGAVPATETTGRVLIADDNADMREYARRLMADRWAVETAANGREALRLARARRPDVIVTDIMMPELDGLGLLRELRADDALRSVPVIMLSARAGEETRIEGLEAGADDYLVKPFSARDLIARVDAQLIKARARALEQQHARRLVNLFTHAPVAIAILRGPEHVYELTNAHYLALIGGREVLGLPIRQALPELAGQGIYELLDRVRASGEPYVGKSLRVLLDPGPQGRAEDAYFDFVYQPVFDADGKVDAIVVVAHDVTELAIAKAEAEEANHSKDEFLATLSHELRTPLNAVLGYTHMLREGMIDAQRLPGVLETIQRNARLQEQLVSDVLDVSRIVTGKLRLDVHPIDLRKVIEDAVETVAPAATAKGVALQARLDVPGILVAGDAQRLQQVVWNLLSNAVKFTPKGGRVEVRLERAASQVAIAVSDTGDGIEADFLPHVFQRFKQADGTFSRTHMGLGLGLAICRHLVEAHGGTIAASSAGKGKGATFRVELPLLQLRGQSLREDSPSLPGPLVADALPPVDLSGLHVLLVDDDVDALLMARDALALSGADVTTASSAHEALSALDRARFDVGILDLGMPRVDGYELLRRIRSRSDAEQGRIPLAALTAYARTLDRARSLQSGFQLHLTKPVHPGELAAAVLALADRTRSG